MVKTGAQRKAESRARKKREDEEAYNTSDGCVTVLVKYCYSRDIRGVCDVNLVNVWVYPDS